ncbi:MAG TPA: hypothetical protein VK864_06395 [Longimicrobiales bacterium]|nr:hypothetical protein [Longimicrobiales bacterium]
MGTLRGGLGAISTALVLTTTAACSGGLGNVFDGVFNAPGEQRSGTVQGVDTRSQTLFIRESDGTIRALQYDNRTRVVYQNQTYAVSSLERGDEVTARVQDTGNDTWYTDYVQVNSSASGGAGGGTLYTLTGTVRQIDTYNGWFIIETQNSGRITISLPYNPRSADVTRFRGLRTGDRVSVQAVYLNPTRYELRQFN